MLEAHQNNYSTNELLSLELDTHQTGRYKDKSSISNRVSKDSAGDDATGNSD